MTLNFQRRAMAGQIEVKPPQAKDHFDSFQTLAAMSERGISVFPLVDWLATMKEDSFWNFGQEDFGSVPYTAGQRLYIEEIWQEVDNAAPGSFMDLFYGKFVPLLYLSRDKTDGTGTPAGFEVEFIDVMDKTLRWIDLQMPHLRALHELDDDHYQNADLATVRNVARMVAKPCYDGRNREDLTDWICAWVEFHIRYYVREFCEREELNSAPAPARHSQKRMVKAA